MVLLALVLSHLLVSFRTLYNYMTKNRPRSLTTGSSSN
uniref:Uncharacterized protein n=1 Tax=Arundo donax TaxID=35708 RepID=A0A0A9C4N8_ARUDO